jgi:DNA sulfur modification protein DndD
MILDEIILHDFGIYGGRQSIALAPTERERPIILFGGLNGGGKTTLLDALQLCFFGNIAQCSGRSDLAYDEYLRRSVHRGAINPEASVEVAFRHTVNGEVQHWRLTRSWSAGESVRERFQVYRNERFDKAASEQWSAQVEDFIPARIAPLFLFDGEKVEGYADLNQAPVLIRTAIQNLLGLDIVERLGSDLLSLERRRKGELAAPAEAEALAALREDVRRLVSERSGHVRERASNSNDIDRLKRAAADLERRYEREGGALYEDRGRLEAELAVTERGYDAIGRSLRELAAGAFPFALIPDLLAMTAEQATIEDQAKRSRQTAEVIAEEHAVLLALPAVAALPPKAREDLQRQLDDRIEGFRAAAGRECFLFMDDSARAGLNALLNGDLAEAQSQAAELLKQEAQLREAIEHVKSLLSAVPGQATVAELIAQREAARDAVKLAEFEQARRDAEIARLDREIEATRERETKLLESTAREQFEQEDVGRILGHSAKVRSTLAQFRSAVVSRHVDRIEGFVLDSFRQLVRKPTLVTGLRIDPQTFTLELRGGDGRPLTSERLSAGERQLLAIAMLWGLARASGRPLPMVIDTPLGRLDAEHRSRLVSRYFPHASHQVMLLSTDEEITREHYRALRPAIGRSYRLRYDEAERRTIVEPGYFANEEAA